MALLFADGFDHYSASDSGKKYSSGTNFGSMSAGLLDGTGQCAALSSASLKKTFSSSPTTFYHGIRWKNNSLGSNTVVFNYLDASGNIIATLSVTSAGALAWYRGNAATLVTSSSNALIAANTVNYLEVAVTLSLTTTGSVQLFLNGNSVASASSIQTANTTAAMTSFQFTCNTGTSYFDDMYLCDNTGSSNNTNLGDVRVEATWVTGNGSTNQWTASSGTNSSCVDETLADGDTTFVSSSTVGNVDLYNMGSAGSPLTVFATQTVVEARKDDNNSHSLSLMLGDGTTTATGSGNVLGTSYVFLTWTSDVNPITSLAWMPSDLSTLQAGVKVIS